MSKVLTIRKALRVGALLKDSFTDTPEVHISVHAVEDRAIAIHASFEGSDAYQAETGIPTYTAELPSTGVYARDLYRAALHPLDHWVDVQVQTDTLTEAGRL